MQKKDAAWVKRKFFYHCRKNELFARNEKVVVACSGGADSVALLHLLMEMKERLKLSLYVFHFEHGIRGSAALHDASFVKAFSEKWEIPVRVVHGDVPRHARERKISLETAARELRYQALEEMRVECGADVIAVAHHADDQTETLLMHLLRGTGLGGLRGMQARRGHIIRPLLWAEKMVLVHYLEELGIPFCHDETNDVPDVRRNELRLEILPALKAYNPNIASTLSRMAEVAGDAADYVRAQAERKVMEGQLLLSDGRLDCRGFREEFPAVQRELLRLYLLQKRGTLTDISFERLEAVRSMVLKGKPAREDLPHGISLHFARGMLSFVDNRK